MKSEIAVCVCDGCEEVGLAPAKRRLGHLPPNVALVNLPCARAFEPVRVLQLLLAGAEGTLILGCAEGAAWEALSDYEVGERLRVLHWLLRQAGFATDRVAADWLPRDSWKCAARAIADFCEALGLPAARARSENSVLRNGRSL